MFNLERLEERRLLSLSVIFEATSTLSFQAPRNVFAASDGLHFTDITSSSERRVLVNDGSLAPAREYFRPSGVAELAFVRDRNFLTNHRDPSLLWVGDGVDTAPIAVERPAWLETLHPSMSLDLGKGAFIALNSLVYLPDGRLTDARVLTTFNGTPSHLIALPSGNKALFFVSFGGQSEIWVSDGTVTGTRLIKSSPPVSGGNAPRVAGQFVYFVATDAAKGQELWRTDGTSVGTVRVKDIRHGSGSSKPRVIGAAGNNLIFTAHDGSANKLWRTDGSEAGTQPIMSFALDGWTGAALGTKLVFIADNDFGSLTELWITDGTAAGTLEISNVDVGTVPFIDGIVRLNNRAYFAAGKNSEQLWRTDGTIEGTVPVSPVWDNTVILNLTAFNGALYFTTLPINNNQSTAKLYRLSDSAINVSGQTFNDLDADGARDAGEPLLANVRVYIDTNNNRGFDAGERTALSDAKGRYVITGLSPGKYRLRQVPPAGGWETTPSYLLNLVRGDHVIKQFGSIDGAGVAAGRVTFTHSSTNPVLIKVGMAGFSIWADLNRNAKLDAGEPTAITDDTGRYAITNLTLGTYVLRIAGRAGWIADGSGLAKLTVRGIGVSSGNFSQKNI